MDLIVKEGKELSIEEQVQLQVAMYMDELRNIKEAV